MKKSILTIIMIAAVIGCQQIEPVIPQDTDDTFTAAIEEFNGQTRTSLDPSNTVIWSAGDEIAIFIGTANASRYKVKAGTEGSSNGTFSKVSSPASAGGSITTNVAIYPYSSSVKCSTGGSGSYTVTGMSLPQTQDYQKESFGDDTFVMAAVTESTSDRNLNFKNASGALMLQLKGTAEIKELVLKGNNGEVLAGSATVTVNQGGVPAMEMKADGSKTLTLDCGNGIFLSENEVTEFIFALPPTAFSKGFTVNITDTEGYKAVLSTEKSNPVGRSEILKMGEMTIRTSPDGQTSTYTNLSSEGRANCYIVSKAGNYRLRTVKGHTSEEIESIRSAEIIWESFGTDSAPSKGTIVKDARYADGYIYFSTGSSFKEGNALIAAKDVNGKIVWSWHIWLTDKPAEHSYNSGYTLMDRNLGATSASAGDVQALGLLYQWGRKDPFLGAGQTAGSAQAASTLKWPEAVISTAATGTVAYATANPTTFIRQHLQAHCWDWMYTSEENGNIDNTRWNRSKGVYDPCPAGWRVCDGGENGPWSKSGFAEMTGFDSDRNGLSATVNGTKVWYPATGFKSNKNTENGKGKLANVGGIGFYWTSEVAYGDSYSHAYYMSVSSGGCAPANGYGQRAAGYAVRCQKM